MGMQRSAELKVKGFEDTENKPIRHFEITPQSIFSSNPRPASYFVTRSRNNLDISIDFLDHSIEGDVLHHNYEWHQIKTVNFHLVAYAGDNTTELRVTQWSPQRIERPNVAAERSGSSNKWVFERVHCPSPYRPGNKNHFVRFEVKVDIVLENGVGLPFLLMETPWFMVRGRKVNQEAQSH